MIVYQVVCSSSWAGWAQWSGLWGGYPNIQKNLFWAPCGWFFNSHTKIERQKVYIFTLGRNVYCAAFTCVIIIIF